MVLDLNMVILKLITKAMLEHEGRSQGRGVNLR